MVVQFFHYTQLEKFLKVMKAPFYKYNITELLPIKFEIHVLIVDHYSNNFLLS